MLYGLNYSKIDETVFLKGFVARQLAGKFIPEHLLRAPTVRVCVT